MPVPGEYLYIPLLVWLYLIIDLMMEVEKLPLLLRNLFFWLYWVVYSIAAEIALYFIGGVANSAFPGHALPPAVLILIAIIGTTTVLQSLTFKIGGKKVLDLSRYLDDYRRKVLTSSAALKIRFERRRVLEQSRLILHKVKYVDGDEASKSGMRRIYAEVLLAGRDAAKLQQEIAKVEQLSAQNGASFGTVVAERIAQADPEWVRNFLAN